MLEVIPFPLHKLLNEVEIELLEQSIDDFTLDHQLKVKSSRKFVASLFASLYECVHVIIGAEVLPIVLRPCDFTLLVDIKGNLFWVLFQMEHLPDEAWRVLLLQTQKSLCFFPPCVLEVVRIGLGLIGDLVRNKEHTVFERGGVRVIDGEADFRLSAHPHRI